MEPTIMETGIFKMKWYSGAESQSYFGHVAFFKRGENCKRGWNLPFPCRVDKMEKDSNWSVLCWFESMKYSLWFSLEPR